MRMEVESAQHHTNAQRLYQFTTPQDLTQIATGSDSDIGGLSRCHFSLEKETKPDGSTHTFGRFYGSLSSQVPRGSSLEKSGYAAFRNKSRPTLFSTEAWDTSYHPYLALRVRRRVPGPASSTSATEAASSDVSLRAALHAGDQAGPAVPRAVQALGLSYAGIPARAPEPPLFFVNIQTDGPVTTDLYQHRLFLDEQQGNAWQTITIPLDSFVLTNTGVVSESQVSMLREKVLTVGISVLMDPPLLPRDQEVPETPSPIPNALRRVDTAGPAAVRGSKRDRTLSFELDIAGVWVVASPSDAQALKEGM